jgi:hypothetical protein
MFAKVFKSLWQGSLVGRSDAQLVFVFMLCHADATGEVDYYHPVIAALTGLPEDRVRAAVIELGSADGLSRSPEEDGRRIVRLDEHRDWGWRIVNYAKYRAIRDAETRKAQVREAVRRHREKKSGVSDVSQGEPEKAQAEVEVEAVEATARLRLAPSPRVGEVLQTVVREKRRASKDWLESFAADFWPAYRRPVGKGAALATWTRLGLSLTSPAEESALFTAIMDGLEVWNTRHKDDELEFVPHPATWLNQRRWEDEA